MDYYFVVDMALDSIDLIVQRTSGLAINQANGKRFVKADGVMMKFYYDLVENVDIVLLSDVMSQVRS